jgi:replicative DNA helicase Mcm
MEQEREAEIIDRDADWSKFLKSRYKKQLSELSREYPYRKSIVIDYRELESFGKTGLRMADELLENPGKVIEDVKSAVTAHQLIKTKDGKAAKDINIRFINLPKKIAIRQIRSDHINTFISVEGILRKTKIGRAHV